jgi:polyisoprenoid-binding protein YceI
MKHLIVCALTAGLLVSTAIAQPKPAPAPTPAAAPANAQKLITAGSSISFTSKQMGVNVEGSFNKFDAQLNFDPKKLQDAKVGFSIDLTSVDIGDAGTMSELKKPGWFDSARVPAATFTSGSVKSTGSGKFEISGNLVIKGFTKPVTVPVSLTQTGLPSGQTRADGAFTIKRLDYKIGDGDWNDVSLVANDVQVKLRLIFTGISPL